MKFNSEMIREYNAFGATTIANIVKTTLGPRSMLKMIIDNQGNIIVTNDGYCVLREIETSHPVVKTLIELSKIQDNEIGDGTTSIVLLSAEFLKAAEILIKKGLHPNQIISGYFKILYNMTFYIQKNLRFEIKNENIMDVLKIISTSICTKFVGRYSRLICEIAFKAVCTLNVKSKNLSQINEFIKIEKILGNKIENSRVISGIILEKDVSHPKMKRFFIEPKMLLIECSIDFKKNNFKSIVKLKNDSKWKDAMREEENHTIYLCNIIKKVQPDVIFTEKNISDLALYYLFKSNISVIRRIKKSDINKLAKLLKCTVISNIEEIESVDIGIAECFSVKKIGEVYYTFVTSRNRSSSCTIVLFGLSKDIVDEIERNLHDAIGITKTISTDFGVLTGGGSIETELITYLSKKSTIASNESFFVYNSIGLSLEIIPKTLVENCGMFYLHTIRKLKNMHIDKGVFYGIEGKYGKICDTRKLGIIEPCSMKIKIIKKAIENATMIIKIDKIFYGLSEKNLFKKK